MNPMNLPGPPDSLRAQDVATGDDRRRGEIVVTHGTPTVILATGHAVGH